MRGYLKWGKRIVAGLGFGVAGLIGYLAILHYGGNFDTVVPGQVYRSAQFSETQLADYVRRTGIRSVLNLRGAAPNADWYEEEIAASARLGLVHADYAMSASASIGEKKARELIELMRSLPKPLLIHCRHGSDRTGLVAALYLAALAGEDEETAEGQLSLYYGHFAVPFLSAAYPMDESWEALEAPLGFEES